MKILISLIKRVSIPVEAICLQPLIERQLIYKYKSLLQHHLLK